MENFENRFDDKRKYKRVDSVLPVQYRNLRKGEEQPSPTVGSNISEGGVCFTSSQFISLACRMVVEISLPDMVKPIKAISKIAWIKRLPSSDQYLMGNQFLEMTKEDKAYVMNFVNNTLNVNI